MTGTFHGKPWYKTWQRWYILMAVVNFTLAAFLLSYTFVSKTIVYDTKLKGPLFI